MLKLLRPCRPAYLTRRFTVLAIESSADDTCAAVVTSDRKILSNVVYKQVGHVYSVSQALPLLIVHSPRTISIRGSEEYTQTLPFIPIRKTWSGLGILPRVV